MSMGIGWPNASSQSTPTPPILRTGYFNVLSICGTPVGLLNVFTNLQTDVDWVEGDYVFCTDIGQRVLLGGFTLSPEVVFETFNVIGPAYNSCEI